MLHKATMASCWNCTILKLEPNKTVDLGQIVIFHIVAHKVPHIQVVKFSSTISSMTLIFSSSYFLLVNVVLNCLSLLLTPSMKGIYFSVVMRRNDFNILISLIAKFDHILKFQDHMMLLTWRPSLELPSSQQRLLYQRTAKLCFSKD